MRGVVWSGDASRDFFEIIRYIAKDSPMAAERVARRIKDAGNRLGDIATGRKGRVAGTYEQVVVSQPWIIAYAIDTRPDGSEVVTILRVIHGARDWRAGQWPQ